jgi:subtilisin family serine protease
MSRWALILVTAALAGSASAQHGSNYSREFVGIHNAVKNEVIVKFKGTINDATRDAIKLAHNIGFIEKIGDGRLVVMQSRSKKTATLIAELSKRPDVEFVQPNYVVYADAIPNDTSFANLWGMRNTGQTVNGVVGTTGKDIKAYNAWDVTTGSRANVVAIVDTGVNYSHPDLTANIWSAPRSFTVVIGGTTYTVPAGSHGFNAITKTFDPMDDNGHGTHCAGTIGGVGNNGVGVAGVNWVASIMGCKFLDASGSGTTADAINAIEFAIQAKAALGVDANVRVLSNSWGGGPFEQALLDEINKSDTNNMVFCAAAGNSGTNNDTSPHYPSSYTAPNIIAVAATTSTDAMASFSCYGATSVDLGAPGTNIYSTYGSGYAFLDGTSMATPHVSGACALLLAVNGTLTNAQVKAAILNNVDLISSMSGVTVTGGRLNVDKAVRSLAPPGPDFSVSATPSSSTVLQGNGTSYTATVTATGGFTGVVNLTVSGLPAGAAGTFSPTSVTTSGSSTLSVTTATTTPAGSYPLTITGTSGTTVRTTTVTLVVTTPAPPDFTIAVSPASQSARRGTMATYTVTVTGTNGFGGAVALSLTGQPSGSTVTFTPASVMSTGTSTLQVTTLSNTSRATYTLTVRGTSGSLNHTATATLTVTK